MLDCTLLLVKCMVAAVSSIAFFAAVVSFAPAVGACSELTHGAVGRRCSIVASMESEGWSLLPSVFDGWICTTAGNRG